MLVIPGGVNSGQRSVPTLENLVIVSASGARFTDGDGRDVVDYHAAFGPPLLGHNDPDVNAAVIDSLNRVDLCGVGVTEGEVELAEQLVEIVPSMERVLLTSTGSEATFHALRLARAATGRRYVVKFQGCYHGWHDAVSLNVISAPEMVGRPDPISRGILPEVLDSTIVLPFNDAAAVRRCFEERGDEIAALILEPIPHNVGCLLPVDGYLEELRRICTEHGTVLVFDEVISGIRHNIGGYQAIAGVQPDLTTIGKALGNGQPIAAIGGKAALMEEFSSRPGGSVFFAGTYNGHPAPVAAALATLKKLRSEPVHEHIFRLGDRARSELSALYASLNIPAQVVGYGSVFVTYFMPGGPPETYGDLLANDIGMFVGYRRRLLRHGVFELPLNLKRSHISYAHTDSDIDRLLQATEVAVKEAQAQRGDEQLGHASSMGGAELQ
jgi:glutamate-1-semialdehyde 2,1-aminomutase